MNVKGQVSFEFIFVIAVVIVVTTILSAITSERLTDLKSRQSDVRFMDVANKVRNEIDIAHSMSSGYIRVFEIPDAIDGSNYSISLNGSSLTVSYENRLVISSIQPVNGTIIKGLNTIRNTNGLVVLNG